MTLKSTGLIPIETTHSQRRNGTPRCRSRGFALVVTLLLIILLTVIAVGLLTLSSVSLRSSTQSQAQATARANARLALAIALGELQKNLGPDQRSTANAAIFTNTPNSLANADVVNPHWLGVFKTRDTSNLTANLEAIRSANVGYETKNNLAGDLPPTSVQRQLKIPSTTIKITH